MTGMSNTSRADRTASSSYVTSAPSASKTDEKVLYLDESSTFFYYQSVGYVDRIVLGTGHDDAVPSDHIYFFVLSNSEFAFDTPYLTIDGSALQKDTDGDGPLFGEVVVVDTQSVNAYNLHYIGGGASDRILSGSGSDVIELAAGLDYVSIGTGSDTVYAGRGADFIDASSGDFTSADIVDGGKGRDELSLYSQNLTDADFANVTSVEVLGVSANLNLRLDAKASAAGIDKLFVDDSLHTITVGSGFTNNLTISMLGDASGQTFLDASASSARVTVLAGYDATVNAPTLLGGTGSDDRIVISNGYVFEGSIPHGGDLSNTKHFERISVQDLGGDSGAYLVLTTRTSDIEADFQSVNARGFDATKSFDLRAGSATAAIHVVSGDADDTLTTGTGADILQGGLGADLLAGGGGADRFVYRAAADSSGKSIDTISDFRSGTDAIDVRHLGGADAGLHGAVINFLGNFGDDAESGEGLVGTAGDGNLDALFRTDTQTLWFDTNNDGQLDKNDLHVVLSATAQIQDVDVLSGHIVI